MSTEQKNDQPKNEPVKTEPVKSEPAKTEHPKSESPKSITWKDQLKARKWGEHKHCVVCGKAIALDKDYCSQPCRDQYKKVEKDKSKKGTWQIAMIFVVMIVMMIVLPMLSK